MKLHIGCGTVYLKGYVNIDSAPDHMVEECPFEMLAQNLTDFEHYYKRPFGGRPGFVIADLAHDMTQPLPFQNNSVDEIVMYQVLEHFPKYEIDRLVADIRRVLRVGGEFIVSVPNIKITARMLSEAATDEEEDWAIRLIHGTQRNRWSHHYCGYVPRTLKALLAQHSFGKFVDMPDINCYPVIHLKAIKEG